MALIGRCLLPVMPRRVEKLKREGFTVNDPTDKREDLFYKLLRVALAKESYERGDLAQLVQYHVNFWSGDKATKYHQRIEGRLEDYFLPNFGHLIPMLLTFQKNYPEFNTICEIGVGNAELIVELYRVLNGTDRFLGLDLSPSTTEINKERFRETEIEFVAADAREWIPANAGPNWIYVTNGGVLEYFSETDLQLFLRKIAQHHSPALFVAIEPKGVDHDLEKSSSSAVYSNEHSFSHHYLYHFEAAGYCVHQHFVRSATHQFEFQATVASCGGGLAESPILRQLPI